MNTSKHDVILEANVAPGFNSDDVQSNLARIFKISEENVNRLLKNAPIPVKKGLDYIVAKKYKAAIEKAGAICSIEPHATGQTNVSPSRVLSLGREPASEFFSPKTVGLLTPEENGVNLNRKDIDIVPFNRILMASVYSDQDQTFGVLLFVKGFRRPFKVDAAGIQFQSFPFKTDVSLLGSLRSFFRLLINKQPGMFLDEYTNAFIQGGRPVVIERSPITHITRLAKALENARDPIKKRSDGKESGAYYVKGKAISNTAAGDNAGHTPLKNNGLDGSSVEQPAKSESQENWGAQADLSHETADGELKSLNIIDHILLFISNHKKLSVFVAGIFVFLFIGIVIESYMNHSFQGKVDNFLNTMSMEDNESFQRSIHELVEIVALATDRLSKYSGLSNRSVKAHSDGAVECTNEFINMMSIKSGGEEYIYDYNIHKFKIAMHLNLAVMMNNIKDKKAKKEISKDYNLSAIKEGQQFKKYFFLSMEPEENKIILPLAGD